MVMALNCLVANGSWKWRKILVVVTRNSTARVTSSFILLGTAIFLMDVFEVFTPPIRVHRQV